MNPFSQDEFGVTECKGQPIVNSISVAERFDKNHDDVLKSIRELIRGLGEISESEWQKNFLESTYKNVQNKTQPCYSMNKKGFTILAMGFTGKKALQFKVAYINRFEAMELYIQSLSAAKLEFPEFTRAIMAAHEEPKHYHFSNEINLINRIVLGMDAKRFKEANNIDPKTQSIRPYLSLPQIKAVEALQKFDIGLIVTVPEYEERKKSLTEYHNQLHGLKLLT
jgi:Rha family phage regulatory protein